MGIIKHISWLLVFYPLLALQTNVALADMFETPTFRAGFYAKSFPDFSVKDVEISVKLLAEEIGREIGIDTKVTVYEDSRKMRQDFDEGIINFVVASSVILITEFDSKDFTDGFRFIRHSESPDRLLVLGRQEPGKSKLEDYSGQRLVLAEFDPSAELFMDYLARSSLKQSFKTSFKQIPREKKAHQLILKLFFNQADITCMYQNNFETAIELNPQLSEKVKVLAYVDNIPQGMGLFHVKTPVIFQDQVIGQALKLPENQHGKQLVELFKGDVVKRATLGDLNAIKKLYVDHQQLANSH